jgi:ADP-ribose pyrophosphatase YjhB (NUDIX family)
MGRRESHIEIIARAIILQQGRVLLCQNVKRGHCYLPGGHVEFGESGEKALARELKEEAGLRVRIEECCVVEEYAFTQRARRRHELNLLFPARLLVGRPASPLDSQDTPPPVVSLEDEITFLWHSVRRLGDVDLKPRHHAEHIRKRLRVEQGEAPHCVELHSLVAGA